MGIKYFTIEYDREFYYPGQIVLGFVRLSLDTPTTLKSIELKITGEANCHWTERKIYIDSDGKSTSRNVSYNGSEKYFKKKLTLVGDGSKFELPIGDYVYQFSISLRAPLPPSFNGAYGDISYYGKAKMILPWAKNKTEKKPFIVENDPIDLNKMLELNQQYENEGSKTFCCWCCASSRPLTVHVYLPRTGFVYTDAIPITIHVDNGSSVDINSVKIQLNQTIDWKACYKATTKTRNQTITIKEHKVCGMEGNTSRTWTEEIALAPYKFTHSGNCEIIHIKYQLKIILIPKGLYRDFELKIPITIGAIPYGGSLPVSLGVVPIPQLNPPFKEASFCGRCIFVFFIVFIIVFIFMFFKIVISRHD